MMIRRLLLGVAVVALLGAPAAADLPLPEPDPERGSIAITLRGRAPAGTRSPAHQVFFVRLDEGVDPAAADSVLPSSFSRKRQVYLLNARPGRYVAVAASLESHGGGDFMLFLSRDAILATEVEVVAGQMALMGDLLVDLKVKMDQADAAQAHYYRLLAPTAARRGFALRAMSGKYMYRGELENRDSGPVVARAFWRQAGDVVFKKHPKWQECARRELEALG